MTAHVIARIEANTVEAVVEPGAAVSTLSGMYHATGEGETTWFGFAQAIVEEARRLEPAAKLAKVEAITTAEYPTPARRPRNSRLDCAKLASMFGWRMPGWRESVRQVMGHVASGA